MEKLLTKYFWTLNLLTLALVAYFLSDGTGELMAASISESLPQSTPGMKARGQRPRNLRPTQSWAMPDGKDIIERNIFDSTFDPTPAFSEGPTEDQIPDTVSGDLPIIACGSSTVTLLATVASRQDTSWSFASVNEGNEQRLCRVGDSLDNRTVSGITWRYLFLRGNSDECFIDLYGDQVAIKPKPRKGSGNQDPGGGIRSISDTEKVVDRAVVDKLMSNPTEFIKSVRVRPHKRNGKVVGFKLRRFRPNSPLSKLGAKRGDIIHSVNGIELTGMDQALGAYQSLNSSGNLNFAITRGGKPMEINVTIN